MKISDVVALARLKSNSNTNTFSDAEILAYLKAFIPQYQADIEKVNEGFMGSIQHRDLRATGTGEYVVGDDTFMTREYNLPADMIDRLDHVMAKLDGENWILLKNYGNERKVPFKEDNIKGAYTNEQGIAGYTIFRKSLFLLTGEIEADIVGGLEIWTYAFPDMFTSIPAVGSGDDVELEVYGIPEQLQEYLAIDLSIEWKSNKETPMPLTKSEQMRDMLYRERLNSLKGFDRSRTISYSRPNDGYDNGFNL